MRTTLPKSLKVQCPACGVPTEDTELGRTPDNAGYGLRLGPCGHIVTLELIRDAWGVDVPVPDSAAVRYDTD